MISPIVGLSIFDMSLFTNLNKNQNGNKGNRI